MAPRLALLFVLACVAAAPPKTDTVLSRIAFGSCSKQDQPQPIWDSILAASPQVMLLLGDNIYSDTTDPAIMRAEYAKWAAIETFGRFRKQVPLLATWDDHDYGVNDGGADYPMKDQSQRLFLEFFEEPLDSPRWKRPGLYESYLFGPQGKRIQIILLDTRYFRGPLKHMDPPRLIYDPKDPLANKDGYFWVRTGRYLPDRDPKATLLGEAQWKWLEGQLKVPAEIRLIGSSIQFPCDDLPFEKWGNFPLEQQRLYKLIRDTNATGILILSGDRHRADISRDDQALPYPLYDITSSSLTNPSGKDNQDEPNRRRIGHNFIDRNFGLLTIDWSATDPPILVEIKDQAGKTVLSHQLTLSQLRPAKP